MGISFGSKRWPYPQPYPKPAFAQMFEDAKAPPAGPFPVPGARLNSDIGGLQSMPTEGFGANPSRRDVSGD